MEAEGHYQRSCYCLYTKDEVAKASSYSEGADAGKESVYEKPENQAYGEDFSYSSEKNFVNHGITQMTELTDRMLPSGNE